MEETVSYRCMMEKISILPRQAQYDQWIKPLGSINLASVETKMSHYLLSD